MLFLQNQMKHQRHPRLHKQERGVVLVIALLIVALVAGMSVVMMARMSRDTARTMMIFRYVTAEFRAQGSLIWAMDQLRRNWDSQKNNKPIDVMPTASPVDEVEGYKIGSQIDDMQARFNLNNLSDFDAQADFKRLIRLLDQKVSDQAATNIARSVAFWIQTSPSSDDQYYLDLPRPYHAAHRLMFNMSELNLVRGMTPSLFQALSPYITALPEQTKINVQTAEVPVLMMLSPGMRLETAKKIIEWRSKTPFLSTTQFLGLSFIKNLGISPEKITVTSDYFLVTSIVSIENQRLLLYTLCERKSKNNKALIVPLWQSQGSWQ